MSEAQAVPFSFCGGYFRMKNMQKSFPFWLYLCGILLAGLLLRAGILCFFQGDVLQIVDETHYNALAVELAQTGNYASAEEGLVSLRPPLYPWFLSRIYRVFGLENYTAVRWAQIFLSLLTTLGVYGLARELDGFLSERGALFAAAAFCFYPSLVGQNFFILSETFFTFWLVLLLWTALHFFRTGSLYAVGFCGIFIAFGALTRSILWLSPFPFALFILFFPTAFLWKHRISAALLLLLFAGVGMAPWMIRNTKIQETFTPIDCMSGRNFMMGNYEFTPLYRAWDAISMQSPQDWYSVLHEEVLRRRGISTHSLTQGQKDKWASWYAKQFIKEHPILTLQRDSMKALCFWQLERSIPSGVQHGFWGFCELPPGIARQLAFPGAAVIVISPFIFVFLLASGGIFSAKYAPKFRARLFFLLAVVLYFWGLHTLAFAHERYHLPLIPILLLFAVSFLENIRLSLVRLRQKKGRMGIFMTFVLIFVAFWGCEICWALSGI